MANKNNRVGDRTPWLAQDDEDHALNLALLSGTEEMRKKSKGMKYLLPNGNEAIVRAQNGQTLFERRVNRSFLRNYWRETIKQTARMPFRARIQVRGYDVALQGTPKVEDPLSQEAMAQAPPIKGWVDDMDGAGLNIDKWAQQNFETSLFEGICYAIVDTDTRVFGSLAEKKAAGARPYVTTVHRHDMVNIVMGSRNGVPRPLMVTIRCVENEIDIADPNNWQDESRDVFKVYLAGNRDAPLGSEERRVRVRFYHYKTKTSLEELKERRTFVVPDDPSQELFDIPIVPLYGDIVSPFRGKSPFIETAFAQHSVWITDSELQGLLREASQTFVHISGAKTAQAGDKAATAETVERRWIESADPQAKLSIVEADGKAAAVLMKHSDRTIEYIKEAHNAVNSRQQTGPVTAREINLEGFYASSALELWVVQHEHAWTAVLDLMALIGGLPLRGSATIPHDFGLPSEGLSDLVTLFENNKMTAANFWREMKNSGRISDGFDIALELAAEKENAKRLAALTVNVGSASEVTDEPDSQDEDPQDEDNDPQDEDDLDQ